MPQAQRERKQQKYPGDDGMAKYGYPQYKGQVKYCDKCQNYSDDDSGACEICGSKIRLIDVKCREEPLEAAMLKKLKYVKVEKDQVDSSKYAPYYLKYVAHRKIEHLRQIVFTPAAEPDDLTTSLAYNLANKGEIYLHGDARSFHGESNLHRIEQPVLRAGSQCLGSLRWGGRLYVVGHGNAGGAIGNHNDKVGARSLVQLLLHEGMPKEPKDPITIWLCACTTGAAVNLGYVPIPFYRKVPFVQRLAEALLASSCIDFYVVGFAGFVGTLCDICTNYIVDDNKAQLRDWRLTDVDERVVYKVTREKAEKIGGRDYIQKTDFRWLGKPFRMITTYPLDGESDLEAVPGTWPSETAPAGPAAGRAGPPR